MDREPTQASPELAGRCVVALPCYNEAAAIPRVIAEWNAALPGVEVVVFDNNSTDGTAEIARSLGSRVIHVREQGKGHVVRAIFAEFRDREAVILADGDGTYPADHAAKLVAPILRGDADMSVGARRPVADAGAMTPIRSLGNLIIPAVFYVLIGPGNSDLLSGYRVFSRRYRDTVRLRSSGFEIETELGSEAVARGMKVVEIPVPYYPRIEGTSSKLRAFRDGRRILITIFKQGARLRPWRLLGLAALTIGICGLLLRSTILMLAAGTLAVAGIAPAAYRSTRPPSDVLPDGDRTRP